jgi:hypothetical protein
MYVFMIEIESCEVSTLTYRPTLSIKHFQFFLFLSLFIFASHTKIDIMCGAIFIPSCTPRTKLHALTEINK